MVSSADIEVGIVYLPTGVLTMNGKNAERIIKAESVHQVGFLRLLSMMMLTLRRVCCQMNNLESCPLMKS